MIPVPSSRFLLYGAVAACPELVKSGVKMQLKLCLDRIRYKVGLMGRVSYKNYAEFNAFNRGDNAIVVATQQWVKKTFPDRQIFLVDWGMVNSVKPEGCDKLVVCGSGYFFPNSQGRLSARVADDLEWVKKSGTELHFLGVGFNYLLKWPNLQLAADSSAIVRDMLELSSTITVRDRNTQEFLRQFTSKPIRIIGDPALFIDVARRTDRSLINGRRLRVGVNVPFHGPNATEWIKKNLKKLIATLKIIRNKVGCDFYYFVHYEAEVLVAKLIKDSGIPLTVVNSSAVDLPNEYVNIDMHIGGMLHSCILATAAGTPSIGLAYDHKHHGFFELMDSSAYCIDASSFDAEVLLHKVFLLLENIDAQTEKIKRRREELESSFREAVSIIGGDASDLR